MSRLMQEEVPPRQAAVVAKRKLTPILKQAKIVLERVPSKKKSPPKKAKLPAHLRRDYNVDLDAEEYKPGPSTSQRQRAPAPRDPWRTALPPRGPTPPARPPAAWGASLLKEIEEEEK